MDKAHNAMYLQLKLFHSIIPPIVLHTSEIWWYEKVDVVEKSVFKVS